MSKWKKGQSGNPIGRPKSALSKAAIQRIAMEHASQTDPDDPRLRRRIEVVLESTYQAAKGAKTGQPSIRAVSEYLDRVMDRPPQAVTTDLNINVSREERVKAIENLLNDLSAPSEDAEHESGDPRVN